MHVLQEVGLVCVMLCLTVSCNEQNGEGDKHPEDPSSGERFRRNVDAGSSFLDSVSAVPENGIMNAEHYLLYTPSTPSPQNINCYVDVPVTVRRSGRCVRLGERSPRFTYRPWACQAGIHLEISAHCHNLMQGRPGRRDRG